MSQTEANTWGHRSYPCTECPWKRETALGRFAPDDFERLRGTCHQPDMSQWNGQRPIQQIFACHMSSEGKEVACAGFLAVDGGQNLEVRLSQSLGDLPADVLSPGDAWPALYKSFEEMAAANGLQSPHGDSGQAQE